MMRGESPAIDKIMAGLADSTYQYGSKFNFQELVAYHETEWLKSLLADSENRLDAWFDEHDKKLFTGGGGFRGAIAQAFLDDVIICPDYATANLQGTAHHFSSTNSPQLVEAAKKRGR